MNASSQPNGESAKRNSSHLLETLIRLALLGGMVVLF
jgi:hypothetical protein